MNASTSRPAARTSTGNTTADKQIKLCNDLLHEVAEVNPDYANQVWADLKARWAKNACTFGFVSNHITGMIAAKKNAARSATEQNRPEVPSGRYAIDGTKADASTRYFRVVNDDGHYNVFAYASDVQHQVRDYRAMIEILRQIQAYGIHEAELRFGRESHRCYECGRRLTRDHAKEAGIGDDCLANQSKG